MTKNIIFDKPRAVDGAVGGAVGGGGLSIPAHDYVALSYTGADLTGVVYKTGGSGGTTVATLALTYTDSVLQTITRT